MSSKWLKIEVYPYVSTIALDGDLTKVGIMEYLNVKKDGRMFIVAKKPEGMNSYDIIHKILYVKNVTEVVVNGLKKKLNSPRTKMIIQRR